MWKSNRTLERQLEESRRECEKLKEQLETTKKMQFITVSEEAADRIYAALEEPPNINQALREVADKMQTNGGFWKLTTNV